jgi:predicted HAD superfamily Cof-like phosphohydrolase
MLIDSNAEDMVREFGTKFEVPTDKEFCKSLIVEEAKEVREALQHLVKEMCDLLYVSHWSNINGHAFEVENDRELLVAILPALDIIDKAAETIGFDIMDEAFIRVHASNMSKLMPDGTVRRRADGKVLKGPNYAEPNFEDLI